MAIVEIINLTKSFKDIEVIHKNRIPKIYYLG